MARLTRAQRGAIERALRHLMRGWEYLLRPDIAVGRIGCPATTTLHYTRADGSTFFALAKDIGSDLAGFGMAERELLQLLHFDAEPRGTKAEPPG